MNFQQIHLAVSPKGEAFIFGSKYLGPTDFKGSRFKYQRINVSFEEVEPAKTVSWNHSGTGQTEQLQLALGEDWKVLTQWELCKAVELYVKTPDLAKGLRSK